MARALSEAFDKWVDLLKEFSKVNADLFIGVLSEVQTGAGKSAGLLFSVSATLVGKSGKQNNPPIALPGVVKGNIAAPVGFHNDAGGVIKGSRLDVEELIDRPNVYQFQIKNVKPDNPAAGTTYHGVIVNTKSGEPITPVVINVIA